MAGIEYGISDLGYLDTFSRRNSPVHRLDPRVKVLLTLVFVVTVVSFDKYEISRLLPFFCFPILVIALADLPVVYILKRLLVISPFVLMVSIFNPFLDRDILLQIGPVSITGGWLSLISILLRFVLTVGAALILIATTGFTAVCLALDKLGAPRMFTVQLLFLYRYIFVLIDEGARMSRARALRSFGSRGTGLKVFGRLLGSLLLRTVDRAQRIHMAMQCRGFTGEIRLGRQLHFSWPEFVLLPVGISTLLLLRFYDIPVLVGRLVLEVWR